LAIKATLQSAFQARDEGDDAALSKLHELLFTLMKSEDVREGVMAMMQKREPVFKAVNSRAAFGGHALGLRTGGAGVSIPITSSMILP